MVDTNSIKSYLNGDDFSGTGYVYDSVSGEVFAVQGTPTYTTVDSNGMTMGPTQYLVNGDFNYSYKFIMSIGFKLFSINKGQFLNADGELENINLSILGMSIFESSVSDESPFMFIYESSGENNKNTLNVYFFNGLSFGKIISSEYESNIEHHFWIVLKDIEYGDVDIYIDGVISTNVYEGSFPAIGATWVQTCNYYINKNLKEGTPGFIGHSGYIDEIVILDGELEDTDAQLNDIINDGFDSAKDARNKTIFCLPMNDLDTRFPTAVSNQDDFLYIGRRDGSIVKSQLKIWESRYILGNERSSGLLTFGPGSEYSYEEGFLKLSKGTVINL